MKRVIYILLLAIVMAGCKKSEYILDYSGIEPIMLIPNTNWPGKSLYDPQPMDSVYGVTQLRLYARVSYATALDRVVKVKFEEDTEMLEAYNAKWGMNYQALPADAYEVSGLELTIPAGEKQGFITVGINPEKFNGVDDYLIAYKIVEAGIPVAANAKTIVFGLKGQ
ncbi:MAG: DUF1735 domain-containing protein [Pedobacter sp.]|nr:MAG: DUF1735 domain-containing protein [Pedobacter sp.]